MEWLNQLNFNYDLFDWEQQDFFLTELVVVVSSTYLLFSVEDTVATAASAAPASGEPEPMILGHLHATPLLTQLQHEQQIFPSTPTTWGHLHKTPDMAQEQQEQQTVAPTFDTLIV